jgi:hypothetical protein
MQKPILASALAVVFMGSASGAAVNYQDPLDARTSSTIKSHFSEIVQVANRHDLKALHLMIWQPPSVLLVAKNANRSEGRLGPRGMFDLRDFRSENEGVRV